MSPTKSTLARYNPKILATRSKSAQPSPVRQNAAKDLRRATIDPALIEPELLVEPLPSAQEDAEGTLDQTEAEVEVARLGDQSEKRKTRAFLEDAEDEDDLPETPQKFQNAPDFQDSPPRGMLFSSGARRRKQKEIPPQVSDTVIVEKEQDAIAGVSRPVTRSRLSASSAEPTREKDSRSDALLEQLDEKRNELNALRKELKELRKGMVTLERHIDMTNLTAENDSYRDISGLLYVTCRGSCCNTNFGIDPSPAILNWTSPKRNRLRLPKCQLFSLRFCRSLSHCQIPALDWTMMLQFHHTRRYLTPRHFLVYSLL
jgi:hypothetical protein